MVILGVLLTCSPRWRSCSGGRRCRPAARWGWRAGGSQTRGRGRGWSPSPPPPTPTTRPARTCPSPASSSPLCLCSQYLSRKQRNVELHEASVVHVILFSTNCPVLSPVVTASLSTSCPLHSTLRPRRPPCWHWLETAAELRPPRATAAGH